MRVGGGPLLASRPGSILASVEVARTRRLLAGVLEDLGGARKPYGSDGSARRAEGPTSRGAFGVTFGAARSPQIPLQMQPTSAGGPRIGAARAVAEDARRRKSPSLGLFTTLVRNCAWHSCPGPVIFRDLC
jgi:hypothetical protein